MRATSRAQGERGVTLILFALAMLAIMIMVAIVIDLSGVRNTRQDSKRTTDAVTAAGLQSLAPEGVARPWRGVCSALTYLRANNPDLSLTVTYFDGNRDPVPGDPCTSLLAQECLPSTAPDGRASWAWIHATDGSYEADIRSGYETPDPAYPEDVGVYSGDDGVPTLGGCDQLAVIVAEADPALFGGAAGASGYETAIRSVGRVDIDFTPLGVPAFLMLERTSCDVLSEQVGSGELGIIVDPADADDPGIIHVDSSGSPATGCDGNNNSGGWAVYSSGTSGAKIVANPSSDGSPGIIAIHALEVGLPPAAYAGSTAAGLSPAPAPGRVVSRKPVDDKYNPATATVPKIADIHEDGFDDATRSSAPDATWRTLTCSDTVGTFVEEKIFVNCTDAQGFRPDDVTFSAATEVIFNGPLHVRNNTQLFMPAAQRVVVGGTSTRGVEVSGGGRLGINSVTPFASSDAGVDTACNGREGPAWANTAQLVIFGGSASGSGQGGLNVAGRAALCQTFVYLAGPKVPANADYVRQAIADGITYDASCLPAKPCAEDGSANPIDNAQLIIQGFVRWSAPNQLSVQPADGAAGVEDLALWTETDSLSEVKSGGRLAARGVYFLPNARVEMRSPALATPQDAQFISRTLKLLQGTLRMQPTPSNAVQVPVLKGLGMVR